MSETRETPAGTGGDTKQFQITDDRSAGRALEGLLFDDGDDADDGYVPNSEPELQGDEAGPEETSATGEDDRGTTEQPAKPAAIEAPKSWPAEDQAAFAKLPPATQAIIARRESEREAAFTRRTQEIADERKGWEAERTAIDTQRQQYLASLQQLTALAVPEAKQFEGIDWATLAAQNPAEYVRLSGMREQLVGRIGALQAEIKRTTDAATADQAKRMQSLLTEQSQKLVERVPEFGDATAAPKLKAELRDFLKGSYGFADYEIDGVVDHRIVAFAVDLMRLKKAAVARETAAAKTANPPPRVQAPGAAAQPGESGDRRTRGLIGQLGKTGSVRDAGRLLESIL